MSPATLSQAIHAVPFRPFELVLADGSRVGVRHPEWIAYTGGRVALILEPDDRAHYVEVMLVTKIELAPPVPAGSIAPEPNGGD